MLWRPGLHSLGQGCATTHVSVCDRTFGREETRTFDYQTRSRTRILIRSIWFRRGHVETLEIATVACHQKRSNQAAASPARAMKLSLERRFHEAMRDSRWIKTTKSLQAPTTCSFLHNVGLGSQQKRGTSETVSRKEQPGSDQNRASPLVPLGDLALRYYLLQDVLVEPLQAGCEDGPRNRMIGP